MKKIFAANWKLYKGPKETRDFFKEWNKVFSGNKSEVVFFPSAISLEAAALSIQQSNSKYELSFGVQNAYSLGQGAFTGENSAAVVKELGGKYVLVGHSERRQIFLENNQIVADKVAFSQATGLVPMLCVGETLEERDAKRTREVLRTQLVQGLQKADKTKTLVIAYEPVWAIGTGRVATPEQVRQTHQDVYDILTELGFAAPILYGGSVKPDNSSGLIAIDHVDGFLVGGASLDPASFKSICESHLK
ncbi:MAG: triose-phosphate isomerase [Bdellovibrionaceae bacterium]|nr:triose-phosphate isomerase [Pseudobdellovibrionaceae bacterium]